LEGEEFQALVADICANGLNEPVWLYADPEHGEVLLDGRNRWRACAAAGVPIRTRHYTGSDPLGFSVSENAQRRHLTVGQRADVALRLEPMLAVEAARRQRLGLGPDGSGGRGRAKNLELKMSQGLRALTSAERAARVVGISGSAVKQFKRIRETALDLSEKVASGVLRLGRAARIARDREAEAKRQAQAASADISPMAKPSLRIEVRHGHFQDALADLRDVDAVITDPPYGKAALASLLPSTGSNPNRP